MPRFNDVSYFLIAHTLIGGRMGETSRLPGFRIAYALGLEVLKEKSGGFREIRTMQATADKVVSTIYRFESTQYQSSHSSTQKIDAELTNSN